MAYSWYRNVSGDGDICEVAIKSDVEEKKDLWAPGSEDLASTGNRLKFPCTDKQTFQQLFTFLFPTQPTDAGTLIPAMHQP